MTVEKLTPDLFPVIYRSFLVDDDPGLKRDDWQPLFPGPWEPAYDHCGYVLTCGAKVVGMLGMLFSHRVIGGRLVKFCNLHSWVVQDAFRGQGLLLMRPVLQLRDHTLTDFTPTRDVMAISRRLGFRVLDAQLTILLPVGLLAAATATTLDISDEPDVLNATLQAQDRTIYHHHRSYACGHIVVRDGNQYCYVVYTTVDRHWMRYCHVHYVSNKELFARGSIPIRAALTQGTNARYVAIDSRIVREHRIPLAVRFPLRHYQLYRPAPGIAPRDVDSLYSEVLLLRLSTYPRLSATVRQWARNLRRGRWDNGKTKKVDRSHAR